MAAYIDRLNPVRAKICDDPKEKFLFRVLPRLLP